MNYKLILIEGIDGSGKGVVTDTFRELAKKEGLKCFDLRNFLKEGNDFPEYEQIKDYDVILSAEPTYGWIGRAIRQEMIRDNKRKYSALAVAQAYSLDRKILYKRLLIKALQEGKIVLQERSVVSSVAYQPLQAETQNEELPLETVLKLPGNKLTIEDYPPSMIIITRLKPETAIQRLAERDKKDVCIFERLEFQKKLQKRYESTWLKTLFEKQGSKVIYLDTNNTLEDTKQQVKKIWDEYLKGVKKEMIITISGMPGSGKTTIARLLAEKLGYNFYSMGDLRGKMAVERGMTIDELNEIGKTEIWTDKEVDDYQSELGKKEGNFVIDGWLSFHFIPHAIKIFLKVNPEESANRIFRNQRKDEEKKETLEEVKDMLNNRSEESRQRYLKYYNVDYQNLEQYDLVLDTTNLTIEEVEKKLINFITHYNK